MQIVSENPLLLDQLFNDLQRERIEVTKETTEVKGGMAIGVTTAIALSALGLKAIDTLINILKFYHEQKNYYIHIELKDGREMKMNNLSKEKQEQEYSAIKRNFGEVQSIDIGRKK